MKNKLNKYISTVHLWAGLISAPIIFLICLTGAILVFADEIIEFSAGHARYVEEVKETKVPVEEIIADIKKTYPERMGPFYMVAYQDPRRSIRFNTYEPDKGLRMLYADPYTGKFLKDDGAIHFFFINGHIHSCFLLHEPGFWIVDIAAIIFLIELITGLYLWWPKRWNKAQIKAAFTIKKGASMKRLNYDLHKVLGFYVLGIALLLVITGLLIAFKPLANTVNNSFGGNSDHSFKDYVSGADDRSKTFPLNNVIALGFEKYPGKEQLQLLTYEMESSDNYMLEIADSIGIKSAQNPRFMFFDKYTGEELKLPDYVYKNERNDNLFWSLHMGKWMGLLGKIITFLGGIIITGLPVTGFYIWWNRRHRKK